MVLSPVETVVALLAVAVGAVVQGTIGFAFVLVAAPVVGLMQPDALPATFVLLVIPMGIWMAWRERGEVDLRGFAEMTAGRVAGTLGAVGLLLVVPPDRLAVLIGAAILAAVGLSLAAPELETGTFGRVAAGGVSGLMGTIAAVGGPAMALAYQRRSAAEIRATLAVAGIAGSFLSLSGLWVSDRVDWDHVRLAITLFPAEVLGLAASGFLIGVVDQARMRAAVLSFAAAGGAGVLLKGLF